MSRRLNFWPIADVEVESVRLELDAVSIELGDRFIDCLEELLGRIEKFPELYARIWKDVRAARIRSFRHVVYYVVLPTRIEVIGVLHGSQDPAIWKSRYRAD